MSALTASPSREPKAESRQPAPTPHLARIGVVSFLNTVPLIDGLEHLRNVELRRSVPSDLIRQLLNDEVDVALCSSIDYQTSPEPLVILPAGVLGCDGATLTVRLYSTIPIHRLTRIHCDSDSHTSIVLLRILMREMYGIDPAIIEYDAREHVAENRPLEWPEAMLLIGDKVVTDSPPAVRYPHQLDLGAAWANLTGLPFVFAVWMMKESCDPKKAALSAMVLDRQRRANLARLDSLVNAHASSRGWPIDLALRYLMAFLAFEWTSERGSGLERFFDLAQTHGFISERRPLRLYDDFSPIGSNRAPQVPRSGQPTAGSR